MILYQAIGERNIHVASHDCTSDVADPIQPIAYMETNNFSTLCFCCSLYSVLYLYRQNEFSAVSEPFKSKNGKIDIH